MIIQSWLVLLMLKKYYWHLLHYHGLFSLSIMEYIIFKFRVYDIWLLKIMLPCIALHYMTFGVMSRTYDCDRTSTTTFIGHNNAAAYLVGYEGMNSYAFICI